MSLTLSEIRNEIRRLLAETSITASYFNDTDLNASINAGLQEICIVGKVYEVSSTQVVASADATYDLPSNFLEMKAVYDAAPPAGNLLDQILPEMVNRLFLVTGDPLYYYIYNKGGATDFEITLVDTPTTAGGGTGTYTFKYIALDAALSTDASIPAIPEEYHICLAYYAAYMSALKAQNYDQAVVFYSMFASAANIQLPEDFQKQFASTPSQQVGGSK